MIALIGFLTYIIVMTAVYVLLCLVRELLK